MQGGRTGVNFSSTKLRTEVFYKVISIVFLTTYHLRLTTFVFRLVKNLNLNVDTAWQFELHQGIYSFAGAAVNIHQPLV
jgi:hypothetical protein